MTANHAIIVGKNGFGITVWCWADEIRVGDPEKEKKKLSSHHCSYQNPSTSLSDLRFNTLAETSHKTVHTSFKYKSGENLSPDAHCTTMSRDYDYKKESKLWLVEPYLSVPINPVVRTLSTTLFLILFFQVSLQLLAQPGLGEQVPSFQVGTWIFPEHTRYRPPQRAHMSRYCSYDLKSCLTISFFFP